MGNEQHGRKPCRRVRPTVLPAEEETMARASWRCDQLSAEEHAAVAPLRQLLGDGAAILGHAGLNQGFGHLSVRVPGSDLLLITPRKNFTAIAPDEMEVVDFAGRKLTANSAERAPNEL